MSPLFLTKDILHSIINEILPNVTRHRAVHDLLSNLLTRPTFEEEFPDSFQEARMQGKKRLQKLDALRGGLSFGETIRPYEALHEWWSAIPNGMD